MFLKLFRSYFITAMIPIIIIEILTASLLFYRLEKNTRSLNNKIIDQCQLAADSVLSNLLTVSYQIANDTSVYDFLFDENGNSNTGIYQLNAIKALGRYAANSDYIKDLCVYSRRKDLLITKNGKYTVSEYYSRFLQSDSYTEKDFIADLNNMDRKIRFSATDGLVLCCQNLGIPSYASSDIFIGIVDSGAWIEDISDSGLDIDLSFAMLDSENDLLMKSENFEYSEELKRHISETSAATSLFRGKSVIMRLSDMLSDIKYIYIANDRFMIGGFKTANSVFLICISCAVLIILYITKINSKKMSQAITTLLDENDAHEDNLNRQVEDLKAQILLNFMHGIHADSNADLFEQCNFRFDKKRFCVIAFEFSMMQELQEIFPDASAEINGFLCGQLQSQGCVCYYVKEGVTSYFYLLNYDKKSIREIDFEAIKNRLSEEYNLSVSLGIGKEVQSTDEISNSYDGALSALKKSGIENNRIIFYDDIEKAMENNKNYYSDEKEAILLRNVKIGNTDYVKKLLDNLYHMIFLENTLAHTALRRVIAAMTLTVYKILDELYTDDLSRYEKFGRVCKNLAQSNDYENNFNILREICLALCADVNQKIGGNIIKHQITEFIEANYMDNSISLTVLAENIGMNYYSLSKLFKEYFGVNFVSHLMMFRMNKAIEKLINTNDTIQQISAQVGFSNSNVFIKNFKKYYGVTPGEYRKMNQNNSL